MVEVGTWRNFDDIEECLILDELLLLTDELNKKHRHQVRVALLGQGVDIDAEEHEGEDDLPEEILEADRKFKAERERKKAEKAAAEGMQSFAEGLGYEVVT